MATSSFLAPATEQDIDFTDEDLPEYLEEFGYEDADNDGPALPTTSGPGTGRNGQARTSEVSPNSKCNSIRCRETIFGDCLGCRSKLQESGITYRGRVTQFFLGVADGIQEPVPAAFQPLGIEGGDKHSELLDLEFSRLPPPYPYPPAPPGTPAIAIKSDTYTIFYGFDQYIDVFGEPEEQVARRDRDCLVALASRTLAVETQTSKGGMSTAGFAEIACCAIDATSTIVGVSPMDLRLRPRNAGPLLRRCLVPLVVKHLRPITGIR